MGAAVTKTIPSKLEWGGGGHDHRRQLDNPPPDASYDVCVHTRSRPLSNWHQGWLYRHSRARNAPGARALPDCVSLSPDGAYPAGERDILALGERGRGGGVAPSWAA